MLDIQVLYLIKTTDKTPYLKQLDPNVFNAISYNNQENYTLNALSLKKAEYKIEGCSRMQFNYILEAGKERVTPFNGFNGYFTYKLSIVRKSVNYFDFSDSLHLNKILNEEYQIIFKDFNNIWYIVYAELYAQKVETLDDSTFIIELTANKVKEGIFRIGLLTTTGITIVNDLTDVAEEGQSLDIIMDDRFIVEEVS